jgi:subtilisin family serine protease
MLHDSGFRGKGMTIAILDAGYLNADIIPALQSVNILGTRDFVCPESDIYAESSHGMQVLSCMAMNTPHNLVGTAPEAAFWLIRSEDSGSEQMVEEDYWAAAIEFADSVGADVVNSSLGYTVFDNPADNVRYWEQDGATRLISRSASMVASKGMVLCCSAGNEGDGTWKRTGCPADAKDVLAVGAIDFKGVNTRFSSLGHTADGRIKPDVMARGGNSAVMRTNGVVGSANGTSFSSPILCGMVACLWQALPHLTSYELMELIRKNGNNASHPDNVYGYGVPDFYKAYGSVQYGR